MTKGQMWTPGMLSEPGIIGKIQTTDELIKKMRDNNTDPAQIEILIKYKKHLEEQLVIFTDSGCIRKTHHDGVCIPRRDNT
jgi:hypothetical protein